ncbi:MAG: hypothetical protein LBB56_02090, partial [Chitinispirillales bacterium]|nr:hypothetical protein [Chitinispirillales bacterium]
MTRKLLALTAAVMMAAAAAFADPVRYEAQNAVVVSPAEVVQLASASGGAYVSMKGGDVRFTVNVPEEGFYTIWAYHSQTCDDSKTQNLVVNGVTAAQIVFPNTGPFNGPDCGPVAFEYFKAAGKVKLSSGDNTVAITNSWGWVDIDYIEVGPHVPEPFTLTNSLVTPNASENARKMYQFMRENFQKKVISGVMTDRTAQDDGKYTPHTINSQPEMAHIKSASGKLPALIGLDFMHSSGLKSDEQWYQGYNSGALSLAENMFNAGGIPIFCWHWKDPNKKTEQSAFYSDDTDFDPAKIFKDAACTLVDENSNEYKNVIADIDLISGYLKQLADKGVAVLWRPLHEAAGGWFWWGRNKNPKPCSALWRLMFDRMVNHHKLNNLIWVWTCEESGDALEWYPGDEYADIIGRDIYPYPNQREKNHSSRVSNFEHLKEIYGASKIIALAENGAVPHPDSLAADGAGWSFFMPWYGDFTTQVNTAAEWNYTMNHSYVITLDNMPGWDKYGLVSVNKNVKPKAA